MSDDLLYYKTIVALPDNKNLVVYAKAFSIEDAQNCVTDWMNKTGKNGKLDATLEVPPEEEEIIIKTIKESAIYYAEGKGVIYAEKI